MKRETRLFVEDILDSLVRIEDYTRNLKQEEFFRDSRTQDAVIRRLEVIGEAVKNLPEDFRERYPDIPWRQAAGLRDVLIHGYFRVNVARVWQMIKQDLPSLKSQISRILDEM